MSSSATALSVKTVNAAHGAPTGGKRKKKKITIKAYTKPPKLPPDFYETSVKALFDTCWNVLMKLESSGRRGATEPSSSSSSSQWSLQQAYGRVVDLCAHQFGPKLYQDVYKEILERAAKHVLKDAHAHSSDLLLYMTSTPYPLYTEYLKMVRHILLPLDRAYVWHVEQKCAVLRTANASMAAATTSNSVTPSMGTSSSSGTTQSLWQVSLSLFQRHLDQNSSTHLSTTLKDAWWNALWEDCRNAGATTPPEIKQALIKTMHMWHDWNAHHEILLQVIQPKWKQALQRHSQNYKDRTPYSPDQFLHETYHVMWQHVSQQYTVFLPRLFLQRLFERNLWASHMNTEYLLRQEGMTLSNLEYWQTLWKLGIRMRGCDKIATALTSFAQSAVRSCMRLLVQERLDNATVQSTIDGLLELQRQLKVLRILLSSVSPTGSSTTTSTPSSNQLLERPLKQMWASTLNDEPARMAEALAKYMDVCLRNPKRTPESSDLQDLLQIFVYLQAKDVFEAFYKKDLAKRLVMEKSQAMEVERQFVSLLKSECGTGYTSKMEGMFQDIAWSKENMALYKDRERGHASGSVILDVKVLTTGYWPMYAQLPDLHLPASLVKPQEDFLEYYKSKYQGRRMEWQHSLGSVDVRARFDRTYTLNMSLCPALVLLCFNNEAKPSWTAPELQQATGILDADQITRILHTLSLGKIRVLQKHDHDASGSSPRKPRSSVHMADSFTLKTDFTSKQLRIRIINVQLKETKEERDKTLETVSRDRLYLIDAVLVRIMKARKTILHQELIPQVMEQIKVPAQPADIKLRIESLIEREYMERDQNDRNRYKYLA